MYSLFLLVERMIACYVPLSRFTLDFIHLFSDDSFKEHTITLMTLQKLFLYSFMIGKMTQVARVPMAP